MSLEITEQGATLQVSILGRTISISNSEKVYEKLKATVLAERVSFSDTFFNELMQVSKDFDTLCADGLPCYAKWLDKVPSLGIKLLNKYNIHDVDISTIQKGLESKLQDTMENTEYLFVCVLRQLDDYVSAKYNSRIKIPSWGWRGFGEGISGTVKAELQATALNFGSAMITSIGQTLIDAHIANDIAKQKNNLYIQFELPLKLEENLLSYSQELLPIVERAMIAHGQLQRGGVSQLEYQELSKKAAKFEEDYKIVTNRSIKEEFRQKSIDIRLEILRHYPTDFSVYWDLNELCLGDKEAQQELKGLAAYFGISNEDYDWKVAIFLRPEINRISFMPESTTDELNQKIKEFKTLQHTYPEVNKSPDIKINEEIKRLQARLEKMENPTSSSSGGCFITSAVCHTFGKPDDCYELTMFRFFRDHWLVAQPDGPALVQEYYHVAPAIVHRIDATENSAAIYRSIWTSYLESCLSAIEQQDFLRCKEKYIAMVNSLKSTYLPTT